MITEKDFEYFRKRVEFWVDFFKLQNWQIDVYFKEKSDENTVCDCDYDGNIYVASINLYKDGLSNPTKKLLNRYACHEVAHVLTARFSPITNSAIDPRFINSVYEEFAVRIANIMTKNLEEL